MQGTRLYGIEAVVHQVIALPRSDLIVVEGIATTGLARTLADLGSVVERDDVERALDHFQRRGYSLRWARETAERLHRPGQRGTGVSSNSWPSAAPAIDSAARGSSGS